LGGKRKPVADRKGHLGADSDKDCLLLKMRQAHFIRDKKSLLCINVDLCDCGYLWLPLPDLVFG
jgi:hypothetical protein